MLYNNTFYGEYQRAVIVKHAARPEHVKQHKDWAEQKQLESLKRSKELWEKRTEFFPNLVLCGKVEMQLTKNIGRNSNLFDTIFERLKKLDEYAAIWQSGSYSRNKLKKYVPDVSGESKSTMVKYRRERKFRLPDGIKQVFEEHIKIHNYEETRIYFYPDNTTRTIYVGYIDPHLTTVNT